MSFSQNNEEQIILNYFGSFKGTLLSLGENNGTTFSNSRALLLDGWSGCLVEPTTAYNPLYELYKDNPNVKTLQAAIGNTTEMGELLVAADSLVSSVYKELTDVWKQQTFAPMQVQFYTFADMLKKFDTYHFDFITMDIEGLDYSVLQQMDLNALGCQCLCIEYWKYEHEITAYCNNFGLKLIYKNGENLLFGRA